MKNELADIYADFSILAAERTQLRTENEQLRTDVDVLRSMPRIHELVNIELREQNEKLHRAVEEAETLFESAYIAPIEASAWLKKYGSKK